MSPTFPTFVERFAAHMGRVPTLRRFRAFIANEDGASIVFIALTLPTLIGAMGLAAEVSYWRLHHRDMQNAADAAVIAAATNGGSDYAAEGRAIAAQYGFQDGSNNVTVTVSNPNTAPGCTTNCYTVAISGQVPLFLSQVVGYQGSATVNGQAASTIAASAVATSAPAYPYCILALASSGKQGMKTDGSPNSNLNGCNTMSDTASSCNGSNLNANFGDAVGANKNCGVVARSNSSPVADPYSDLAKNIPTDNCSSYPQETKKGNLPKANQWSGTSNFNGYKIVCGDQQLTGDAIMNATSSGILVIENGMLDTNGFTLSGTNLTIIFSGANNPNYQHIPTDTSSGSSGTLDIAGPTSGDWSGVAIYQDPKLTTNVDLTSAGNKPTWDISGLVYMPHSSVTLSGAINKATGGLSCFDLVVDNVTINGTGSIYKDNTQCPQAGLVQPKGGHRGTLVN
jgi:Flp pilus assembly protein TadG